MRNVILLLMLFVMTASVYATDYLIEDGDDFGSLALRDDDTFLMTGGTGNMLDLGGWSTGVIENTNPITAPGVGGVWEVWTSAYSELTINDGEFYDVRASHESVINLYGGDILGDLMVDHDTTWVHIYGYGFNNAPYTGGPVTGFWADGTPFSIDLVDDTISTYDQIVFHIPEPATMLMLGVGGLFLRTRK